MQIHTTIGIYPNGDYTVNGVYSKDLENHIEYNRKARPGRTLMVDGEIVLNGYQSGFQTNVDFLNKLKEIKKSSATIPYL